MSLRVVMMGTGEFALPAFLALIESEHAVVGLFTQPDRAGRGHHHHPHPMKEAAVEHGVPVFQPENVNTPEALNDLRELSPDLCVVAAYGQLLSRDVLEAPRFGAVNIHASILPKYRGASPIQYAVKEGESETGITVFQIEPKLDAGPILGIERTPIGPDETSGELHDRLAALAAPMIVRIVGEIAAGRTDPLPQSAAVGPYARRLRKEDGVIDWSLPAQAIHDHIRAMQPWPKAFTWLRRSRHTPDRILVHRSAVVSDVGKGEPGQVLLADGNRLIAATGQGGLELLEVQPEGKRKMTAGEFQQGHPVAAGDVLCTP